MSVTGYNPRLDLAALSKGLSAATQNHADHVGGLFYDDNKVRARTHLWRPLGILILGNTVACFVHWGKGADLTPPPVTSLASPHRPLASDSSLEPSRREYL